MTPASFWCTLLQKEQMGVQPVPPATSEVLPTEMSS